MEPTCEYFNRPERWPGPLLSTAVRYLCVCVAICLAAILGAAQEKDSKKPPPKLLAVGEAAPDWNLSDAAGQKHTLSEYRGKLVVMDFWATWCEPCKEIMPRMQKLFEKYHDKDVVVLGVNAWEQKDPVAFMQKKRFAYQLLIKGEQIADSYRVTILPSIYMIGFDGRIVYSHIGVDHRDIAELIEKYLKEQGTTSRTA